MKGWLKRIRGAFGMGLIWAGGGAAIGGLIELIANLFPGIDLSFVDMWIPFVAIPGFVGGVVFSTVLRVTAGRRSFDELSFPRLITLGALSGVAAGLFMMAIGIGPLIIPPATVLGALGGSLTLALARMGRRELPAAEEDEASIGESSPKDRKRLG
jgi:hypothetical protein